MNLVELDSNRQLIIHDELYGLKAFKRYHSSRSNKDEEYIINELLYVYFMNNTASDYMIYNDAERHVMVLEELDLPVSWTIDKELQEFIDFYNQFIPRLSVTLKSLYSMVDKIIDFNDSVDLHAVDKFGKPRFNTKDFADTGTKLTKLNEEIVKVDKLLKEQTAEAKRMRGGRDKGLMEDGLKL